MKQTVHVLLPSINGSSETLADLRKRTLRKRKVALYAHSGGKELWFLIGPELDCKGEGYQHIALVQAAEKNHTDGYVIGAGTLGIQECSCRFASFIRWRLAMLTGGSKWYDDLAPAMLADDVRRKISRDLKAKVIF